MVVAAVLDNMSDLSTSDHLLFGESLKRDGLLLLVETFSAGRCLDNRDVVRWGSMTDQSVAKPRWSPEEFDDLIAGFKNGDSQSISELWRWFNPRLLRFLKSMGVSDPEDLAQESWISMSRAIWTFTGEENNFKALLFLIARRRLMDQLRVDYRRPKLQGVESSVLENIIGVQNPSDDHASLDWAMSLVSKLPQSQAEVVALRVIGGLDVSDVATVLGRSEGSVRVLSHRGLTRLAEYLAVGADAVDSAGGPTDDVLRERG